ncbi:MAG: methylmalonyl Co-A mutase-associated GTPase MeaB [Acidimicrobiales bacterium]
MTAVTPAIPEEMLPKALAGDRLSLARMLSMVERGGESASEVARVSYRSSLRAQTVGVTGAPGAGKSTLVEKLIAVARASGKAQVAVVAVDPTSPFSGGAILGDRIRMQSHASDNGVFIRSMASRGHLGGLSIAVPESMRLLEAAGMDPVIIETVGVGQVEIEVASATDTTVVVLNPGWGDSIQANKAGILEIADILVVNKADRQGAREAVRDLEQMLDMSFSVGIHTTGRTLASTDRGDTHAGHGGHSGHSGHGGHGGHDGHSGHGGHGTHVSRAVHEIHEEHDTHEMQWEAWRPPVLKTIASSGEGMEELWSEIERHGAYLEESGQYAARRRRRAERGLGLVLEETISRQVDKLRASEAYTQLVDAMESGQADPYEAAERLIQGAGFTSL